MDFSSLLPADFDRANRLGPQAVSDLCDGRFDEGALRVVASNLRNEYRNRVQGELLCRISWSLRALLACFVLSLIVGPGGQQDAGIVLDTIWIILFALAPILALRAIAWARACRRSLTVPDRVLLKANPADAYLIAEDLVRRGLFDDEGSLGGMVRRRS